jgi:GntR family transcriptional regulator
MPNDPDTSRPVLAVPARKTAPPRLKLNARGALLHRQLYVLLKEQIVTGRYRAGDLLPTQEALCRQFSISRITVRRALADLGEEGFIRNRQGVGAFVAAGAGKTKPGPDFSFIGEMRRTLKETTMKILLLEVRRCPRPIAAHLGLAEDEDALHLVRTRSYGNRPVTLFDGWIPLRFAKSVTAKKLRSTSLHELIAGSFEKLGRVAQEVNAALADPVVAQGLNVEINSAVLKIDRLVHNRDGAAVHHVTVWTTPQRTRLVMEVGADDIDGYNVGRLLHDVQR